MGMKFLRLFRKRKPILTAEDMHQAYLKGSLVRVTIAEPGAEWTRLLTVGCTSMVCRVTQQGISAYSLRSLTAHIFVVLVAGEWRLSTEGDSNLKMTVLIESAGGK